MEHQNLSPRTYFFASVLPWLTLVLLCEASGRWNWQLFGRFTPFVGVVSFMGLIIALFRGARGPRSSSEKYGVEASEPFDSQSQDSVNPPNTSRWHDLNDRLRKGLPHVEDDDRTSDRGMRTNLTASRSGTRRRTGTLQIAYYSVIGIGLIAIAALILRKVLHVDDGGWLNLALLGVGVVCWILGSAWSQILRFLGIDGRND